MRSHLKKEDIEHTYTFLSEQSFMVKSYGVDGPAGSRLYGGPQDYTVISWDWSHSHFPGPGPKYQVTRTFDGHTHRQTGTYISSSSLLVIFL